MSRLLVVLAILAFVAVLLYGTLSAQKVECTVCVDYNGGHNCATASHSSEQEATQSAQTTACGPLARGMNESIACGRTPPVSVQCRSR